MIVSSVRSRRQRALPGEISLGNTDQPLSLRAPAQKKSTEHFPVRNRPSVDTFAAAARAPSNGARDFPHTEVQRHWIQRRTRLNFCARSHGRLSTADRGSICRREAERLHGVSKQQVIERSPQQAGRPKMARPARMRLKTRLRLPHRRAYTSDCAGRGCPEFRLPVKRRIPTCRSRNALLSTAVNAVKCITFVTHCFSGRRAPGRVEVAQIHPKQ